MPLQLKNLGQWCNAITFCHYLPIKQLNDVNIDSIAKIFKLNPVSWQSAFCRMEEGKMPNMPNSQPSDISPSETCDLACRDNVRTFFWGAASRPAGLPRYDWGRRSRPRPAERRRLSCRLIERPNFGPCIFGCISSSWCQRISIFICMYETCPRSIML